MDTQLSITEDVVMRIKSSSLDCTLNCEFTSYLVQIQKHIDYNDYNDYLYYYYKLTSQSIPIVDFMSSFFINSSDSVMNVMYDVWIYT